MLLVSIKSMLQFSIPCLRHASLYESLLIRRLVLFMTKLFQTLGCTVQCLRMPCRRAKQELHESSASWRYDNVLFKAISSTSSNSVIHHTGIRT